MSRELPIFPLPLVLFPGVAQPLHVFEPRYRQLLNDCLAADRRFGITYVEPKQGEDSAPHLGQAGCVAVIRGSEALPDGRSNIFTRGERRFTLDRWLETDRMYRVASVTEFEDQPEERAETGQLATDVRQAFSRLLAALATLADQQPDLPDLPFDPTLLSFRVAAALELDQPLKQALLESRSARARLRRLEAVLGSLARDAEGRASVHRRARGNGKGGTHPHIERMP